MQKPFTLIQTDAMLKPLLESLTHRASVALDTEADSRHHYYEKICLIQIGTGHEHWIVDPLAGLDLGPLVERLAECELLIHGADYDLRMLDRTFGFRPRKVFDTMLATQLLGWDQWGLAAVVERICGVTLCKDCQKADWSRRPLSAQLLDYAADDVRHLHTVVRELTRLLKAARRLSWHEEACERLVMAARDNAQREPRADPWRIKGGKSLRGRAAAVLRELWQWRDRIAQRLDRPPFMVAGNDFLLQWCRWIDGAPDATFEDAPDTPRWLHGSRLQSFEHALRRALESPPSAWPVRRPSGERNLLTRPEEDLLKRVIQARDELAHQLELDPGVLGPRDALKTLVRHRHVDPERLAEHSPLMQWQNCQILPVLRHILSKDGKGKG